MVNVHFIPDYILSQSHILLTQQVYTCIYERRNILSHLLEQISNAETWTSICDVLTLVIQ